MLYHSVPGDTIEQLANIVRAKLEHAEAGHDWSHIQRVWHNARSIAQGEKSVRQDIVEIAAILHDIADPKFHDGDEDLGPKIASQILEDLRVHPNIIKEVTMIIRHMSFKNNIDQNGPRRNIEFQVVQDADRLDAIGAIGIARAFAYGGYKNRKLFDPGIPPMTQMTKEQYTSSTSPTINHFYEKLLKLKDQMNTETGKKLADERHEFMKSFLSQFYVELGISPSWHQE